MSGIRGKNTKPEITVRKALHARGFRYRLHVGDVPGSPDFVLPKFRVAAFVHGCFWHGHDCPLFRLPKTRQDFWKAKIERNRSRDQEVVFAIEQAGWRRLTVWECALRGKGRLEFVPLIDSVACWLNGVSASFEIRGTV